jgi:hypothetical protein
MGSCIGKACETLVTVKSFPAAEFSQQQNSGYSVAASPLATANETRGEGVSAGAVAPAPAGIIVSTAGGEIPAQSETAASEPAMMDQAIRIGMPEPPETASPTETGDSLPQVTHNLEAEPLPDPATPAGTPANPDVKSQPPAPAKARNAGKPKDPRRQGVAQPDQKPAAKAAKPAAPKRGLAEAVPEKAPPGQKAVPASKPSAPPVVATAKPPEDIAQSAQGDPAPGFQILNNLNNEFFSFQP